MMTDYMGRVCAPIHAMRGCSIGVIESACNLDRMTMLRTLLSLARMGYIDVIDSGDRRIIRLTDSGVKAYYEWLRF